MLDDHKIKIQYGYNLNVKTILNFSMKSLAVNAWQCIAIIWNKNVVL